MTQPAQTFERQTTGGSFVAYEKAPSKIDVPIDVNGQAIPTRIHSEVFIQEYVAIRVKSIKPADNGKGGLYVELDPASVPVPDGKDPLRRAINASTVAGGDIEKGLRWALANNAALYVGLELSRKYKRLDGSVIPYDTPIMELRGFTEDGETTDAAQGMSRNNISKRIAVIGFADHPDSTSISPEAKTDPLQWPQFRANRVGKTPPAQWVRVTRPDGSPGGAAILRSTFNEVAGTATAGGSAQLDDAAIAKIAAAVADKIGPTLVGPDVRRPPMRSARSAEAKRWDLFNSDGRINPGSYATTGMISTRATALTILEGVNFAEADTAHVEQREPNLLSQTELSATATKLMVALTGIADTVQSTVTGLPANRVAGSRVLVARTIAQIATRDLPMTRAILDDVDAKSQWLAQVTDVASDLVQVIIAETQKHAGAVAEPAPVNDASGRAQREVQRQNPPTEAASTRPALRTVPANETVTEQPQPDFTVDDAAPTDHTAENTEILRPLLAEVGLGVDAIAPMLVERYDGATVATFEPTKLAVYVQAWQHAPQKFLDFVKAAQHRATTKAAS